MKPMQDLSRYVKQETAKDGMAGLQSGNNIWETDWEQA